MTNPISLLFDWLLGLTRPGADPSDVRAFVNNPTQAASQAMGTAVTQAQLTQAASAVVAPAALYGFDNPIQALQHTVADNSGLTFAPQRVFAPETDFASHNDTEFASHNDIGSPRAGEDVQQGVGNFDLDFDFSRDINASNGAVVNTGKAGNIDTTSVHGDGNIVGDHNGGANTGDVYAGQGSNVQAGGKDNHLHDSSHDVNTTAGGDVATNTGSGQNTQVGDIDTSGGGAVGGNAGGHGGGLIDVGGHGGGGGAAAGGSGGGVIIAPTQNTNSNNQANSNNNNQSAGHDVNNVDAPHSIAPVVVGNEHNETALGGDVTHVDHVNGPVDASHDDSSLHNHVDTHVDNHLF
ncbi:hypothetical protein [Mycobacterium sp. 1274761.0]|uniref:hypothetical protein n=1 Tax=Mycobacterium sp. 1274761.0 TaxID=1834077 RepID=UPI0007FE6B7C|nr:hypothetical protein [Mycobacterium sp. 1274761.0]OBK75717.1 hypothetical protein A5651_07175 [Mycobacterium sp. 1274761.0]